MNREIAALFAITVGLGLAPSEIALACDYGAIPEPSPEVRLYATDLGLQFAIPQNYSIRSAWGYSRNGDYQVRLEVVDPATFAYDQCLVERGELLGERTPPLFTLRDLRLLKTAPGLGAAVQERYPWLMSNAAIEQVKGMQVLTTYYQNDYQQSLVSVFWLVDGGDRLVWLEGLIEESVQAAAIERAIESMVID
ncbi:MAG: hypothetical protein AAGG51_17290 [Cyanobacteria bacterium P01_G01_bin.54]